MNPFKRENFITEPAYSYEAMTATSTTANKMDSELIWLALGLNLGLCVAMAPWDVEILGLTLTIYEAEAVELFIRAIGYIVMVISALRLCIMVFHIFTGYEIGADAKRQYLHTIDEKGVL